MKVFRNLLILLIGLVLTAIIIIGIYLFLNNIIGSIVLIVGLLTIFTLFVLTLIGLVRGHINRLKLYNRFSISVLLSYIIFTGMLLSGIWFVNFGLSITLGELTAKEKINFILKKEVVTNSTISNFIEGYPSMEHNNLTFTYHPETEGQVKEIISTLESITKVEKSIFGSIPKNDRLEVIVFKDSKDYFKLNPFLDEEVGGTYESAKKRVMIYQKREKFEDDESFMIGTFAHEYSHYILDLFSEEIGINYDDIPSWYNEGISEYISNQIVDRMRMPGTIDRELSFTDLHTSEEWDTASERVDVYYYASMAINHLVEQQGDTRFLSEILIDMKETKSFEEAFVRTTNIELSSLNHSLFFVREELQKAMITWQNSDFESAEKLYEEIIEKHPSDALVWHQFSMMLEEQGRWDEALNARRKVVSIDSNVAASYLNISYLLTLSNPQEAMENALISLELTKKEPYGNVGFVQKWVDEISHYHQLISKENYFEAYKGILQSEQLSFSTTIYDELKRRANEKFPGEFGN